MLSSFRQVMQEGGWAGQVRGWLLQCVYKQYWVFVMICW